MKKMLIIGNFLKGNGGINGQTQKTLNYYLGLSSFYEIDTFDTSNIRKRPFQAIRTLKNKCKTAEMVLCLPDKGGLYLLSWFLPKYCKNKKIYYSVVGGWLPVFLKKHPFFRNELKKFNGIWVEKEQMMKELRKLGLHNVNIVYNFKIYNENKTNCSSETVFCYVSRIHKEKGIFELMEAFDMLNKNKHLDDFIKLDIYGLIEPNIKKKFLKNVEKSKQYIEYKGLIEPSDVPNVITKYYMQLFPTKCKTEGIPGSIIDSFAAGLPIIATKWNGCDFLLQEGYNCLFIEKTDPLLLKDAIEKSLNDINTIKLMRLNCLQSFEKFKSENIIKQILELLNYGKEN